jgi:hypothetical protein
VDVDVIGVDAGVLAVVRIPAINSRVSVAVAGFGQVLPPLILEFFGSANSTICLASAVHSSLPGQKREARLPTKYPAIHLLAKIDGCAGRARA